jgi:hypothetical protein
MPKPGSKRLTNRKRMSVLQERLLTPLPPVSKGA